MGRRLSSSQPALARGLLAERSPTGVSRTWVPLSAPCLLCGEGGEGFLQGHRWLCCSSRDVVGMVSPLGTSWDLHPLV